MTTTHKLLATLPHGDPDLGAEQEAMITFAYHQGRMAHMTADWKGGYPHPDEPDEIEFVSAEPYCNGKPSPFYGAFADCKRRWLNDLAEDWLATDEGYCLALAQVEDDDDRAREHAAELRDDR